MAWRYCGVAQGWGEPHICRDDGREPQHGGRPHRSHQALARRLQLGPVELCSAVLFPIKPGEADPLGRSESPIYCKGSSDTRFCLVHLVQRSDWVCPRGKVCSQVAELANSWGEPMPPSFFGSSGKHNG